MQEETKKISFKYIFPSDLRELHVNGAYGGLSPDGSIRMSVYSERQAVPNFEKREINADQTLGKSIEEEKKYDMVRVVQADLVLDAATAKAFVNWLNERLKEYADYVGEIKKRQAEKETK